MFQNAWTRNHRPYLAERDKELELTKEDRYELDDQLLNVIAKAISYDTEDRFQSADEFIKAIDGEVKIERQSTQRKILSQSHSMMHLVLQK